MKIPIRLRPFLHTAKAVPRRLFQSVLAVWLLGGAMGASYAGECDAVYSVVERHGKLSVPCVQLDDGIVYKAQLDQVRGATQFLFKLKTISTVDHPVEGYATFDSKTSQLVLPVVETNLGGNQRFYRVQMLVESQEADDFIVSVSGASCLAKIVGIKSEPIPDELKAGQTAALRWTVKNVTPNCNASNYRLNFHSATLNEEIYSGSAFGGDFHPYFSLKTSETGPAVADFIVPNETGDFKIYFEMVDGNGKPLPMSPDDRLYAAFTVVDSSSSDGDGDKTEGNSELEAIPLDPTIKKDKVAPGQAKKIAHHGAELDIGADAVEGEITLGIKPLELSQADSTGEVGNNEEIDDGLPPLDQGMINVTKGKKGFRFLPRGMKFKKKIKIKLPYNKSLLPSWKTEQDIKTFYFDKEIGRWAPLERVAVDTKTQEVTSYTDHFTDMINSVVTVPEAPESVSFNPTQIKDIKAADPGAGINLIEVPQANNMGDMRLSYPIEIPPGRVGMQPQLGVSYSSAGGNGWMGLNWDLSVPSVSIHTGWGVPRYDASLETETYTLSGGMLTPMAHRDVLQPRSAEKIFRSRVEGAFQKIIRHGTHPNNYWWEVTDKNGSKSFYGGDPENGLVADAVVTDYNGNIFKWALRETRDTNGNNVQYRYVRVADVGLAQGSVPGYELYIKTIYYTGYQNQAGRYKVTFIRDRELGESRRPDITISARGGFKQVTADLLRKVEIRFDDQPVRSYVFNYREGAFRKTLLESITQLGEDGAAFNTHTFDYYDDARNPDGSIKGFIGSQAWNAGNDNVSAGIPEGGASAIGGNSSETLGGHFYIGIGPGLLTDKKGSGGVKVGFNKTSSEGLLVLMDINGDGLPDKLYKKGGTVYYRPNQSGPNGGTQFGEARVVAGLPAISKQSSRTTSSGVETYFGATAGYNKSNTFTEAKIYFSDVNSDGLVDLVYNGKVLFNHIDQNGHPFFSPNNADTLYPIGSGAVDTNGVVPDYEEVYQKNIDASPLLDTLRRWIAPWSGQIRIVGGVALLESADPKRQTYTTADGVRVVIQHNETELWSNVIEADDYAEKIATGVDSIKVAKGDVIYFRVQSRVDGAYDQVSWNPDIQYLDVEEALDANGLDGYHYNASDDFSLLGHRGMQYVAMPFNGTVRLAGELQKGLTTDDVTLLIFKNNSPVPFYSQTLAWNQEGSFILNEELEVTDKDGFSVQVKVDSPIDFAKLQWNPIEPPRFFYVSVSELETATDQAGNPLVQGRLLYRFDVYPKSDLVMPLEPWIVPETGTYRVKSLLALPSDLESNISLTNIIGDEPVNGTFIMTVKRRGELLAKQIIVIKNNLVFNREFYIQANQGDKLFFEFSSLDPTLESQLSQKSVGVFLQNATIHEIPSEWIAPASGSYKINPLLTTAIDDTTTNDSVTLLVKRGESIIAEHVITITDGVVDNGSITIKPNQNEVLRFELSELDPELEAKLTQKAVAIVVPNSERSYSVPIEFHSARQLVLIPESYRGWSVFGYDGNRQRATTPVEITADDIKLRDDFDPETDTLKVVPYFVDPAFERWMSIDENAWAQAETLSSSRKGLDNIEVPRPHHFAGARAISRLSRSENDSVSLGLGVSAAKTDSTSVSICDYRDMNADRFPDIVCNGGVQYSTMLGGLESGRRSTLSHSDKIRKTTSDSKNVGFGGGTFPLMTAKKNSKNLMASLGFSGNVTDARSDTNFDLMDINGDGLPDRLIQQGSQLLVAFNLGYGFASPEIWGNAAINHSASTNASLSGNLGVSFNTGYYSFAGGATVTCDKSQSFYTLLDINSDGLLDIVTIDDNTPLISVKSCLLDSDSANVLRVRLNTGSGFTNEITWPLSIRKGISVSSNAVFNAGVYFTIPIPLVPPLVVASLIINPGADFNKSMNRPEVSISDINGDGHSDYLYSTSDDSIKVGLSPIGRTNLLKAVHRPLGATITVDYARSGNTYAQPHSKWVMSRVEVNDGHSGDGVDVQVKTYRYEDGFYNRQERDFYGYRTLVEEHRDASQGDKLYRSITRVFHNNSYYNKGLLVSETTADAEGNKYLETQNRYFLRNLDTGNELVSLNHLTATVFPELRRVDKRFYEGEATPGKTTHTSNQFDALGNIVRFVDAADVGAQDDVEAEIGYFKDEANYIVGKANSIVVKGNGTVMRRREATFESGTGNLTQVRIYLKDGRAAVTDIVYDQYGNLSRLTGTENYRGQRYSLEYVYDDQVHTHNVSVTDSFGYVSTARYNLKYGKVVNTTDINNQPLDYTYDKFGRVATIVGPYQTGSGLETIRFAYHPEADDPWALTTHIDVYRDQNDPIETVLFTDGLKRVLQTKKDATIHTGIETAAQAVMTVSGHVSYDFIGRGIEQYYPITEALGRQGVFNSGVNSVKPTKTTYDVLDRSLCTTIPDDSSTCMDYGFGEDRNGKTQFWTRVTDANGIYKDTYKEVRGVITAVKEFNNGGSQILWTSYEYDPMKQIVSVMDDHFYITEVSYDNLGRRTHIDNPDMGLTETVYDLASNVREKITENLRADGEAIVYDYDYNRLTSIHYPLRIDDKSKTVFPSIDVRYSYGEPGAADNRANRIITVADQSGMEERFYGPLGETVKTIKTVDSDTQGASVNSPEVYTTEFVFDTWNRLQRLVYPDGEVLTNQYDSGGSIRAASGKKAQHSYTYLKRLEYDKFGQRQFVDLGNNVRTRYSYNPLNRRLATLKTGKPDEETGLERMFQDLTYQYDNVGNILGQANLAAVESPSKMGGATQFVYQYDDLYRLVSAEGTFDYQPDKQHRYQLTMTYDSIHNIVSKNQLHTLRQPSGTLITQKKTTYDWHYEYAGYQPHAPTHIGDRTFSYDANGNQTGWEHDQNGTRRTLVWDEENRIQSISDNGHTKTYKYNDAGQRVIKRGPQGETAYINQFFVIRNREVGTKHIYAGTTRLVSKLMKQDKPGKNPNGKVPLEKDLYYYHPDHLGSSAYVSDTQGKLFQHLEYFPFGETFVEQSSNTQRTPYHFTAKEMDEEIGMYYFPARYYDPRTSIWQSPDPILAEYLPTGNKEHDRNLRGIGGVFNTVNLNLYHYAGQNPIRYIDPTGMCQDELESNKPKLGLIDRLAQLISGGARYYGPNDRAENAKSEVRTKILSTASGRKRVYTEGGITHDLDLDNSGGGAGNLLNPKVRKAHFKLGIKTLFASNKSESILGKLNPISRVGDLLSAITFISLAAIGQVLEIMISPAEMLLGKELWENKKKQPATK